MHLTHAEGEVQAGDRFAKRSWFGGDCASLLPGPTDILGALANLARFAVASYSPNKTKALMRRSSIDTSFRSPVIPVIWDPTADLELLSHASAVFLQGGSLVDLPRVVEIFASPQLSSVSLFVHIDLLSGLENNEEGLKYLSKLNRINGVVTIHHHLTKPARQLGLLSIVRLFLSDSRALERGLSVVEKSKPDALEILPAAVAVKVSGDFAKLPTVRIAGGLCRNEADVRELLGCGYRAATSTSSRLWRMNLPST